MDETKLICGRCKVPLEVKSVTLTYLAHHFKQNFPQCPVCGELYLSEELVKGKMHDVEVMLEDK